VLPKEIEKARAHGDLRENSEYKAALERQQFTQARVHHLRLRLSKLSNVSEKDIPRDRVGSDAVTVQDLDTKVKETYALTLGEFVEGGEEGRARNPGVDGLAAWGRVTRITKRARP
jgi:transcription elongation factor GreA